MPAKPEPITQTSNFFVSTASFNPLSLLQPATTPATEIELIERKSRLLIGMLNHQGNTSPLACQKVQIFYVGGVVILLKGHHIHAQLNMMKYIIDFVQKVCFVVLHVQQHIL